MCKCACVFYCCVISVFSTDKCCGGNRWCQISTLPPWHCIIDWRAALLRLKRVHSPVFCFLLNMPKSRLRGIIVSGTLVVVALQCFWRNLWLLLESGVHAFNLSSFHAAMQMHFLASSCLGYSVNMQIALSRHKCSYRPRAGASRVLSMCSLNILLILVSAVFTVHVII